MQKVTDMAEYLQLVKRAKTERGAKFTNQVLFPDAIERYIRMGRLGYEEQDAGIIFFADEERFYGSWYYLNENLPFTAGAWDKPVLIQHYFAGEKNERLLQMDEKLAAAGFVLSDTMRQYRADAAQMLQKIRPLYEYARKKLDEDGFVYRPLAPEEAPLVRELQDLTPEIPVHQLNYFSYDELLEQQREGRSMGIFDRDGKLCAAHLFFPTGKTLNGWHLIRDEYKEAYGMGLIMKERILSYAVEHGYGISAWIVVTNTPSIRYHKKLGYEIINRSLDEWVFDPANA